MKAKFIFAVTFAILFAQGAAKAADVPACADLDLRQAAVGQSCLTEEGFEFRLEARENGYEVWRDVAAGTLWSDRSDDFIPVHADALAWCASAESLAQRAGLEGEWFIPSRPDFDLAEAHGFRQVLPNMPLRFVWTSTIYKGDERFAYVFSGSLGTTTSVDMRDPSDAHGHWHGHVAWVMARCMSFAR